MGLRRLDAETPANTINGFRGYRAAALPFGWGGGRFAFGYHLRARVIRKSLSGIIACHEQGARDELLVIAVGE